MALGRAKTNTHRQRNQVLQPRHEPLCSPVNPAGAGKSRAIFWDGRNFLRERLLNHRALIIASRIHVKYYLTQFLLF
jgi:hypothetical protein